MKRIVAILLTALLLLSVTGCGSGADNPPKEPSAVTPSGQSEQGGTQEQTSDPVDTALDPATVSVEETVLLDEAGVKITAKSLDMSALFGPELKLLIENESGKNLTVQTRSVSVNGYMIETMLSADVATGKKANDTLTFLESDLKLSGITTFADMEISFHIFDSDSWDTYLDSGSITLKTSAAEGFPYSYDDSGEVAYEGDGIRVVVKGLAESGSLFGPGVILYIENTSDRDITVQTRDVSVNGFMIDPFMSVDVCAGKHAVTEMTFMSSDLEENDIEEITDIEVTFHIFDLDTWDTVVDTAPVTITF